MAKIQNDLYNLDITIDGLSLFTTDRTILVSADIYEAIMNPIPTCALEVYIPTEWLDNRTISDGTVIKFIIKSEMLNINEICNFRIFNINKLSLDQRQAHLILDGSLDFFNGYQAGNHHNMFGTSSAVFQNIANEYNLTSDIDTTNDSQLWVAGMKNVYQFMVNIAEYGWVNETSGMFWCFDRHKTLLYKNLTTLFRNRQDKVHTFVQLPLEALKEKEKQYEYAIIDASIQSGTNNIGNEGYGGEEYYFDTNSYSLMPVAARKAVAESKAMNISKELSQGLLDSQYPFNVGNFHPNYYLAYKQNRRILATYSTYMKIQCQHLQNFRLGQIVNVEFLDSQTRDNKTMAMTNVGIIDAIHVKLSKQYITANVEVAMQGLNGKVTTREVY